MANSKNINISSLLLFTFLFLCSCNHSSDSKNKLEHEKDSLQLVAETMQTEMNDYISSMNKIQENINRIRVAERTISVQKEGELHGDINTAISNDLEFINDLILQNRKEIDSLVHRLSKSSLNVSELGETVTRLNEELEVERKKILELQIDIINRDLKIRILDTQLKKLQAAGTTVVPAKSASTPGAQKSGTQNATAVSEPVQALPNHPGWYAIGTKEELQQQKITSNAGVVKDLSKGDFNKNYFTVIDSDEPSSIRLYSDNVRVISNQPSLTYFLELRNNLTILHITNPAKFWAKSKYLVIEIE